MGRVTTTRPIFVTEADALVIANEALPGCAVNSLATLRDSINEALWHYSIALDLAAIGQVEARRALIAERADALRAVLADGDGNAAYAVSAVTDVMIGAGELAGVSRSQLCNLLQALSNACTADTEVIEGDEIASMIELVGNLAVAFECTFNLAAGGGGYDETKADESGAARPNGPFLRFVLAALRVSKITKRKGGPHSAESIRSSLKAWRAAQRDAQRDAHVIAWRVELAENRGK